MEKKLILQFIFVAIHAICFAQSARRIDSLLHVLKKQKEDTVKVNTLNALARNYYLADNDSLCIKYAENAKSLSQKLNFKKGAAMACTNQGSSYINFENYDEAMIQFQASLKFAEDGQIKALTAVAYNSIGNVYWYMGNAQESVKYYYLAAKASEEAGDKKMEAMAYYNIGNAYYSPLSNFTEAIKALTLSLNISNKIGDKMNAGRRHLDIANNYESLGNYPEAIKQYLAAIKLSDEVGNRSNVASGYNNIGEIYNNLGNYPEALKYFLTGLKIFEEKKDKENIAVAYSNIAEVYAKQGKYIESMKYLQNALELDKGLKYPYGMAYDYSNIGNVYFDQSKYEQALNNYLSSLKLFKEMEENEGIAKINGIIGKTYFKIGNAEEAMKYLSEALSAARQFGGKRIMMETYESLMLIDSAEGNWQQAYQNQKLFAQYRDSLLSEENSNKIQENIMQFWFDKKEDSLKHQQALTNEKLIQQELLANQHMQSLLIKENEMALLNREKRLQQLQLQNNQAELGMQKSEAEKKQNQLAIQSLQIKKQKQVRNYLLVGFALLTIIAAFGYYSYRTRQQLKLQMLRNKIASDLHDDVGSTLSSISMFSQMAQQQSKETIPLLDTIGDYSRKMLEAMADIVWTINPENDQFEQIILRMRNFAYDLLGTKKIEFEFDADEDVASLKLSMEVRKNIYLIFKEATNNMVKYSGADKALFRIKGEKNILTMLIRDNGKGFDTSQSTNGNGLRNMKNRAEEMGAHLMIDSAFGKGTTIELSIAV